MPRKRGIIMTDVDLYFAIGVAVVFVLFFSVVIISFIRMERESNRRYKAFRADIRRLLGETDDMLF